MISKGSEGTEAPLPTPLSSGVLHCALQLVCMPSLVPSQLPTCCVTLGPSLGPSFPTSVNERSWDYNL